MTTANSNPVRRKRKRSVTIALPTLADVEGTEWGEAMKALPTDRHRAFVLALYQVKPGHGANVKAARLANFGLPDSTPETMATIASRLAHDERILAAVREMDQKVIRGYSPFAIQAVGNAIADPSSRDHIRAVGMILDRVHPVETTHNVKVQHDATPSLQATAEVLQRISDLAAKAGIDVSKLPPMLDVTPVKRDAE